MPRIADYAAKWDENSLGYRHTPVRLGIPPADAELVRGMTETARACWRLFGLRGYARMDFRCDEAGRPYVLEINPNPCLEPEAGFAAAAAHAGLSYVDLVDHILRAGIGATAADVPRHRASGGR